MSGRTELLMGYISLLDPFICYSACNEVAQANQNTRQQSGHAMWNMYYSLDKQEDTTAYMKIYATIL